MSTNKVSTGAQTGALTSAQTPVDASARAGGQTEAHGTAPAAMRSVTRDTAPEPRLTTQSIRSFVLRQGRMSPAQKLAYETLMPRYGIRYVAPAAAGTTVGAAEDTAAHASLDFAAVFGRAAPTILEIGSGMGETTAAIAEAMPENNFIAVEVHTPGVGALLKLIGQKKLTNLRVIQHDAVEVVQQMLGENTLAGIHLFFADPWPKARHHKRRIVQPPFVKLLASRLAPGGYLHCATDWEPYAQHMIEVLSSEPQLTNTAINTDTNPANYTVANSATKMAANPATSATQSTSAQPAAHTANGFAPRPHYRPITKFETRGIKLGHGVRDLIFTKNSTKGMS